MKFILLLFAALMSGLFLIGFVTVGDWLIAHSANHYDSTHSRALAILIAAPLAVVVFVIVLKVLKLT